MARGKKKIQTLVVPPVGQGVEIFRRSVNEVYCDMVRNRLLNLQAEEADKKKIIENLVSFIM